MNRSRATRPAAAFSLVEVVLALGVTSFCLLALFGVLSAGLSSNMNTFEQAGASSILAAAVADLYATPATSPPGAAATSTQFSLSIPAAASSTPVTNTLYFPANSLATNATAAQSVYRLTVTPIIPASSGAKTATFLDLKVTWPAGATLAKAAGTDETFVALNRN